MHKSYITLVACSLCRSLVLKEICWIFTLIEFDWLGISILMHEIRNFSSYMQIKPCDRELEKLQTIRHISSSKVSTTNSYHRLCFWPCQRNLIKTFLTEANTPLITKIALKFFWTFPVIRLAKLFLQKYRCFWVYL